jgi:hypothetical protein
MNNQSHNPLIWVNDDQSEFYLSQFDINKDSFLDKLKIAEIMTIVTNYPSGDYGQCYSIFSREQNLNNPFDYLIGQTFTQALQHQLLMPFKYTEFDVLLSNMLRVRTVLNGDLYLENSTAFQNTTLILQQLKGIVRVKNLQPNRLYVVKKKKVYPTQIFTENVVDFVLSNPQIFF